MKIRFYWIAPLLLGALGFGGWWMAGGADRGKGEVRPVPSGLSDSHPAAAGMGSRIARGLLAAASVASAPPAAPDGKFFLDDAGSAKSFTLALDELIRRNPEGIEERVPVQSADVAGLRTAWKNAQQAFSADRIFPVVYEDGVERTKASRRLVTEKIRVELDSAHPLEGKIPGAVEQERPEYAPDYIVAKMPDSFAALDRLAEVRRLPGVRRADVLLARQQSRRTLPNDTLIGSQWHLKNTGQSGGTSGVDVNVEPAWNYGGAGYRGSGIVVGVVDDGLETAHPDIAANVRTDIDHDWNDSTADDPNPVSGDDNNHGTCCAGNVAAVGNNALGVSGTAPEAKVVALRLIAGSVGDSEEAEAMAYRNDVISIKSNSWGPDDNGTTLEAPGSLAKAAFQAATTSGRGGLGTVFLWAGGNGGDVGDNSNYDGYANSIYTIAIGAFSNRSTLAYYSEPGANLIVVAPSGGNTSNGELDITTTDRTGTNGYNTSSGTAGNYCADFNGTSSATPTAAGCVALMLQRNPSLGWRDVQEILIKSAKQVNPSDSDWITNSAGYHFNHKFGAGLIDAAAAVNLAATWINLGAQTSAVSTQAGLSVPVPNNNSTGITRTFNLGASNIRVEQVTVRVTVNHTARGNLAITLMSPGGVASRLAEAHSDTGDNYADWTFMTVRDWGENSAGTWTLKIADLSSTGNSTGGTLTAAELTVFGSAATPTNPAPTVQLTSPGAGAQFSIGATVGLAATASDLTISGTAGVVSRVDFYANGSLIGSDATAPYGLNWTPPSAASYTLQAKAVDSEGAEGSSSTIAITVANQPPVVTAAAVTPSSPAFSDQSLVVSGLAASDPEGGTVTLAYRWQSSVDGVNFSDAAGQTAVSVAASSANAGKVWRCVVTPSDGVNTGAAFTTNAVMVVTRPAAAITRGADYSYASDLVLRGTATTFTRSAIINEFSQGSGTAEWVEILTLQAGSFRQWVFDDGTSDSSLITFANSAVWDSIPAGTLIVIYTGGAKDAQLPADDLDSSDGKMVIASNNSTYFSGAWPALGNSGDALVLKNSAGATVHQIGYGSSVVTPNIGSVGSGTAARFTGDTEAAAAAAAGWSTNSSSIAGSTTTAGVTPGAGNSTANAAFVGNLRSGYFSQPALYRFAASSQTPAGLVIASATGVVSGAVTAAAGIYTVVIERYNGLGEIASLSFQLTVNDPPPDFATWITGYSGLPDSSSGGDPDGDGRSNLQEYFHGLNPGQVDATGDVTAELVGDDLVIHYRRSKSITGLTEAVQWSTDLVNWSSEGVTFDADQDLGTTILRTARKASGGGGRIFLRLNLQP